MEDAAFVEARDDAAFTPFVVGLAAVAVLLAGLGSFLYAYTVLDATPDHWFVDTFVLGSIFTILLFFAGVALTYVVISQLYGQQIAPDALARVVLLGYLPFAIGFFVFIPEAGFAVGVVSILAMFFYTNYGLRVALPGASPLSIMISVLAGFAVWLIIIPLISGKSSDFFVTGGLLYGLSA